MAGLRGLLLAGLALASGAAVVAQTPGPPAPPPYVPPAPGKPVESRPPNGKDWTPANPEQTRAPYTPSNVKLTVETVTEGLEYPWGMAVLPDGRFLVTERKGRMRIVSGAQLSPPVAGLPEVHQQEISGLADVALDPNYAKNHLVYWTFVESRGGGSGSDLSVARGRLVDGAAPRLEDVKIIYRQLPDLKSEHGNFGGRMLFDRTGALYVTLGDLASDPLRPYIQKLDNGIGKIVRITTDGAAAKGNPFAGRADAKPEIWAYGFRNPLSIAFRPGTNELWTTDVGPFGGDELNLIKPGRDYGWPYISYGLEYSRRPVGYGPQKAGLEQPVYYWDPVISPSSLAFYDGRMFPEWKGNALVTSLSQRHLVRLMLKGDKVVGEERLLPDIRQRLRLVKQAADGSLYLLTDEEKGKILRVVRAKG